MVDRDRAAIIARRAADGIPRVQVPPTQQVPEETAVEMVRISARIPAQRRDALRRLAAQHGLSVASLIDLLAAAAHRSDCSLSELVETQADVHRRRWGGAR